MWSDKGLERLSGRKLMTNSVHVTALPYLRQIKFLQKREITGNAVKAFHGQSLEASI
jgi:hypothetical protein